MKISRYTLTAALALFCATTAYSQVYDTYVVPVVGKADGAGGTEWLSSLYVFNPQQHPLLISVTFLPSGLQIGDEVLLELPANSTAVTDDVLGEWFQVSGTGSLLIGALPTDNPSLDDVILRSFQVRSRTYNDNPSGTYGQAIPGTFAGLLGYQFDEVTSIAEGIWNAGTIGVSGYRTNVGGVNLGERTVTLLVTVYDSDGNVVEDSFDRPFEFTLHPYSHFQELLPVSGTDLTLEFLVDDPLWEDPDRRAIVFPYVSVVDNRSGDASYINPRLLASASYIYGEFAQQSAAKNTRPTRFLEIEDLLAAREGITRSAVIRRGVRIPR